MNPYIESWMDKQIHLFMDDKLEEWLDSWTDGKTVTYWSRQKKRKERKKLAEQKK